MLLAILIKCIFRSQQQLLLFFHCNLRLPSFTLSELKIRKIKLNILSEILIGIQLSNDLEKDNLYNMYVGSSVFNVNSLRILVLSLRVVTEIP